MLPLIERLKLHLTYSIIITSADFLAVEQYAKNGIYFYSGGYLLKILVTKT